MANFMLAADPILEQAAELARVITRAHQGAATHLIGDGWAHARKYFSLSEKYASWADYDSPARGVGIHAYAHKVDDPLRLTDEELRAHPEWRNFGDEVDDHPPMRGWLAAPLIGFDGDKGVTMIPGGGYRTSDSHLTERYRLLNDGNVLSVTFTWEDANVFRTPHTYEFRYLRAPRLYEAQPPLACNPFDDARTTFLSQPGSSRE